MPADPLSRLSESARIDLEHLLRAVIDDGRAHGPTCGLDACVDCWREDLARACLAEVSSLEC
jgi:hypothetical protein